MEFGQNLDPRSLSSGGRNFSSSEVDGLIPLYNDNSIADRYCQFYKEDGTAYVVPADTETHVLSIELENSQPATEASLRLQYQDNDIGTDSASAGTTPVEMGNVISGTAPHLSCSAIASGRNKPAQRSCKFVVPTGKYIAARLLASTECVGTIWVKEVSTA